MIRKDREALLGELRAEGWTEEPGKPGRQRPPAALLLRMSKRTFHLLEADILQQIVFAPDEGTVGEKEEAQESGS